VRITDEAFSRVTAGLYAAGIGERDWYAALRDVVGAFGGAGGVVFDLDTRGGGFPNWIGPGLEQGADEYQQHLNAVNPRMHRSLQASPGHLMWDYRALPEDEMPRNEFYDWVRNRQGFGYFVGSRLFDDPETGVSTFTAVEFTKEHGHASKDTIRTYAMLCGHIANSWRLSRAMQRQHVSERLASMFEAHSGCGTIAFDQHGGIRAMNDRAAAIIRQRDGLYLKDGVLFLHKAADTRKLHGYLGACLAPVSGGPAHPGGAMAMGRPSGRPYIVLRAMPIVPRPGPRPPGLPAALLLLDDPVAPIATHPRELRVIYGFSRREAALAVQLSAGVSLRQAAAAAGMSYNTARNHVQSLLAKAGARNQIQLVNSLRALNSLGE
jgi:DNA-binding CsgD family transcriptional regulator/PAS domain-containing protein